MVNQEANAIIMDFDGVIADSFGVFSETLPGVLNREPFNQKEIKILRDSSSTQEVIARLDIKKWQLPGLMLKGRQIITSKMGEVDIFDGMEQFIINASPDNDLYILSSNNQREIVDFLDRYDLKPNVKDIYSGTSLFGKAKRLSSLLKRAEISINRAVYVGDETRDVEASHQIGMRCIAVTWGYSSVAALRACEPDFLVKTPLELERTVLTLGSTDAV